MCREIYTQVRTSPVCVYGVYTCIYYRFFYARTAADVRQKGNKRRIIVTKIIIYVRHGVTLRDANGTISNSYNRRTGWSVCAVRRARPPTPQNTFSFLQNVPTYCYAAYRETSTAAGLERFW